MTPWPPTASTTLSFPGLTSYAGQSAYYPTIQANGDVIDLSHLTTLSGSTYPWLVVNALAGGKVNLSNLTSYTAAATHFTADGAANGTPSTIDLSKLTGLFSDTSYHSLLPASNGGSIVDPVLTTLNQTDVTTDSPSTLLNQPDHRLHQWHDHRQRRHARLLRAHLARR